MESGHLRLTPGGTPLRVLVVSESLPYPPLKGGDLRTWQNVNGLADFARVGVFGLCSNDNRRHRTPPLPLTCWTVSTDPAVAYPPPTGTNRAARAWLLEPRGHPSDLYFSADAARELADLSAHLAPDVALVEGLWLHRYLDLVRAAARRTILDCHNVEAAVLRALGATNTRTGLEGRVLRDVLPARTEVLEREAIASVDQVWVCSDQDERRMRDLYDPRTPIAVVPNGLSLDGYEPFERRHREPPRAEEPLTLLFPGIFSYLPNAIAAAFLVDEIFPRLAAEHENCRLLLVGAMPTAAMRSAAEGDSRIVVTGPVPDMNPYLAEASVMVVPLFHGGGTHLKVLEAFAALLPVVSTRKGAEGLDVEDGAHLLLADEPGEFVSSALALWRDRALAERLAARARALVEECYSWTTVGARIRRAIDVLDL